MHRCSTDYGSTGSPILNLDNNKVIAIHKEGTNYNYNMGTLLKLPIKDFITKRLNQKMDKKSITINNIEYKIIKKLEKGKLGKFFQALSIVDNKQYAI